MPPTDQQADASPVAVPPTADGQASTLLPDLLLRGESSAGAQTKESTHAAAASAPGNGEQ